MKKKREKLVGGMVGEKLEGIPPSIKKVSIPTGCGKVSQIRG